MKKLLFSWWLGLIPAFNLWAAAGNVWLEPATTTVAINANFNLQILVDSSTKVIGNYDVTLTFDRTKIVLDTAFQDDSGTCNLGVCPGIDAFGENFLDHNIFELDDNNGILRMVGFDNFGKGPDERLHILTVNLTSLANVGDTPISLTISDLSTVLGDPIGPYTGTGSTISITENSTDFFLTIVKNGTGTGYVYTDDYNIDCGNLCSAPFTGEVVLHATPDAGSTFKGWSGATDCSDGTVNMDANKTCIATFDPNVTAPNVTTNPATNVTSISAILNGQVNSNGATAAAIFDFGPTLAYGTTVTATPNQIYGNVAINAIKTGLNCVTTYNYRARAVNSAGTGLGNNQSFVTSACSYTVTASAGVGGTVTPNSVTVNNGAKASFTVTPNNGYSRSNVVTGTCAQGTWNGNVWTTGAISATCIVKFSFNLISVNGICGTANGGTFNIAPNANLCSGGTASAVNGNGPWTWSCAGSNGGTTASCAANISNYTVTASTGNGGTVTPTTANITYGATATFTVTANSGYSINNAVSGNCAQGTWNGKVWTTGAITANCSVSFSFTQSMDNGVCGSANGSTLDNAPTSNLCSVGTASAVSGSGPWNWTCAGSNGGTTASCTANAIVANAWLAPPTKVVLSNEAFTLDVTAKSNNVGGVGSYYFVLTFDPTKLRLDQNYPGTGCVNGVCPGMNSLDTRINTLDDSDITLTRLDMTGSDVGGTNAGNDLQLLVIHFKSRLILGPTPVSLEIVRLATPGNENIGRQAKSATVKVSKGVCGDANGDLTVNIVDALAISRKLVGLPPPPSIDIAYADVSQDGRLSLPDALHIARYSVGFVTVPEICEIGSPL